MSWVQRRLSPRELGVYLTARLRYLERAGYCRRCAVQRIVEEDALELDTVLALLGEFIADFRTP